MCVHISLRSVWVAAWPLFGKELLTRLTICSFCILTICNFSFSRFGVEGCIWGLIASVPGLCILLTSNESFNCVYKQGIKKVKSITSKAN